MISRKNWVNEKSWLLHTVFVISTNWFHVKSTDLFQPPPLYIFHTIPNIWQIQIKLSIWWHSYEHVPYFWCILDKHCWQKLFWFHDIFSKYPWNLFQIHEKNCTKIDQVFRQIKVIVFDGIPTKYDIWIHSDLGIAKRKIK